MNAERSRNPWIAIMVAAAKGQGLRLTPDEVWALRMDDAIETAANNCLSAEEWDRVHSGGRWPGGWPSIDPAAGRESANKSA